MGIVASRPPYYGAPASGVDLSRLLDDACRSGEDGALRAAMLAESRLPGPRLNLRLLDEFAATVVDRLPSTGTDPVVGAVERLLDSWAATSGSDANDPVVVLPCAAVLAYGWVGAARPEWYPDEISKLVVAAADPRWRVRELVATACQRLLEADWPRTIATLLDWSADPHPLVVRAAVAAVAEPRVLDTGERWVAAMAVQRAGLARLARVPLGERRSSHVRTLRQALGFTVSVVGAASGDFGPMLEAAQSGDPDLRWVAAKNAEHKRLDRWPDQLAELRAALVS
jgi:hypothetical protein